MNWKVCDHAKKRIKERFGVGSDSASNWANQLMRKSTYLGTSIDKTGKESRMFGSNSAVFIADLKQDVIVSVFPARSYDKMERKFKQFANKERSKVDKDVQKNLRKIERLRAEIEVEIGQTRMKLSRARKESSKMAYQARLNALSDRLNDLPTEINEVKYDGFRKSQALAKLL